MAVPQWSLCLTVAVLSALMAPCLLYPASESQRLRQQELDQYLSDWLSQQAAGEGRPSDAGSLRDNYERGQYAPEDVGRGGEDWRNLIQEMEEPREEGVPTAGLTGELEPDQDWPVETLEGLLGEIGGVATDKSGTPHVFHRAQRTWQEGSFDEKNVFSEQEAGPIPEDTVFMLNQTDGTVINKWGQNLFYLPHGMTIDKDQNFWLTDVALHQVFKFEPGKDTPSLTLGKAFEPAESNNDTERFCKPTDVAVASNGDFFVADGYCNSRVLKYNAAGDLLGIFGQDEFWVAHSLALAEDLDLLCVADREDRRIACYNAGLDDPKLLGSQDRTYVDEEMGRVFAITYSQPDGLLYAVTAATATLPALGYTIDLRGDGSYGSDIIATWAPSNQGFDQPHDLDVTPDGTDVYVGEIDPNSLWKMVQSGV